MKSYFYKDGFIRRADELNPKQIKSDEEQHGELRFVKLSDDRVILCFYGERGGAPTWRNKL